VTYLIGGAFLNIELPGFYFYVGYGNKGYLVVAIMFSGDFDFNFKKS